MVENACPLEWDALRLHLRDYRFIDCNDTSALLFPVPNCCTGVGVQTPVTEHGQSLWYSIPNHVTTLFINPRRTCVARVTVVVLCVCVCLSVCL